MTIADIGLKIQYERKRKGLLQEELANQANITTAQLSRYENGKQKIPIDKLMVICKILNIEFILKGD